MTLTRRLFLTLLAVGGSGLIAGCSSTSRNSPLLKLRTLNTPIDTLILDFDGTLTKIEEEAKPYVDGYRLSLARELGLNQNEIDNYWNEARTKILRNPEKYGWQLEGIAVASATSDPILICYPIADEIFTKVGKNLSPEERRALLGKLFLENRPKMGQAFKEGADEFLSEVYDLFNGRVYVVTNSSTDDVSGRISRLPSDHSKIRVLGGAKKYVVANDFEALPKTITISGLERPVYLRRQNYNNTLDKILQEQNTDAPRTAVIGDIWELDLALPQYLGMHIGLTPNPTTPQYEKDVVINYSRGFVSNSLEGVYNRLKERI